MNQTIMDAICDYNFENYGEYGNILKDNTDSITIYTKDITKETWQENFNNVFDLMLDAIETDQVQKAFIKVIFDNGMDIDLSVTDYWFNLIMWNLIVSCGESIQPKHIFFDDAITRKSIKKFIDKYFINIYKDKMDNLKMNNIIDDTLDAFRLVDKFSFYLCNTINIEDTIKLMKADPEFNALIHMDLSNVPIEDVKNEGMKGTNRAIEIMKNSRDKLGYDHCLADSWRANEAINPRQYKEFSHNIGTKPNNEGGIFTEIINRSFLTGGVYDAMSLYIESYTGRMAQTMSKTNVGESGHFARILGMNNTDSILNPDPKYACDSKNFQVVTIGNTNTLSMLKDRWYRLSPNGIEKMIHETDMSLVGKTIYLRSPMTCASAARGQGICYRCYGNLAYTNKEINVGKFAAEVLTAQLTQRLLSAKHLLETKVVKLEWNPEFLDYFELEANIIKLDPETDTKGFYMYINSENMETDNDEDYKSYDDESYDDIPCYTSGYNDYITEFDIKGPNGININCHSKEYDKMYISEDLMSIIRKKSKSADGKIYIDLATLQEIPLFFIVIQNNELSKAMKRIIDIINKNSITKTMNRDQLLQEFITTIVDGDLNIDSVHLEVILMNQIRSIDDTLEKPDWTNPGEPCNILTLNQALTDNPSVINSLMYQKLSKALYTPMTFRKHKPSFMDLFFMEQPQVYLEDVTVAKSKEEENVTNIVNPISISEDFDEE